MRRKFDLKLAIKLAVLAALVIIATALYFEKQPAAKKAEPPMLAGTSSPSSDPDAGVVPEPATVILLCLGLGGLGAAVRLHRRRPGAS